MYRRMIRESLARIGCIGVDARHVEAWMRLEHCALDGLSRTEFQAEVAAAVGCIRAAAPGESEGLALSYALEVES